MTLEDWNVCEDWNGLTVWVLGSFSQGQAVCTINVHSPFLLLKQVDMLVEVDGHAAACSSLVVCVKELMKLPCSLLQAVRLESAWSDRVRYMVVVYTSGRQDTEENILLGIDFSNKDRCVWVWTRSRVCPLAMVVFDADVRPLL